MKKIKLLVSALAMTMTMAMSVTSFAGWQQDSTGWWWQNSDGSWPANSWQWIDGNNDGVAECYYFDGTGYMLANTTTPDGYQVNADGAWTVNGAVQTQAVQTNTQNNTNAVTSANSGEIAAAMARAKAAGAGSYQDRYISGGWKTANDVGYEIRASKDSNGMIISPTSGIVARTEGIYDYPASGSDKSIKLNYDPSGGNLQPNWLYNPMGETNPAPDVICMDKNVYTSAGWTQVQQDFSTGDFGYRMDTCDTSGSWVYNPNPSGSTSFFGVNVNAQLSGWMYRYADGTYAANGIVYIYDTGATWDDSVYNLAGSFVIGDAYYFNENGFLVVNSERGSAYLDEYGRVCDGTAGPFGQYWYYDR